MGDRPGLARARSGEHPDGPAEGQGDLALSTNYTLAYVGALTRRIKIGTGILVLPVRDPVLLAKEVGTLQYLTDDRFLLGIGPGWNAREYEVTGSHISQRGRRTDEIMDALAVLLTEQHASYQGKYYQFSDVEILPRPNKLPDVWVSGGSRIPDPTEDPDISRVTLTVDGAVHPIDQVTKQLHKLVNVIKIRDMDPDTAVAREMALFRINAAADNRAEIIEFTQIFRAHIVDVSRRSITVEVTSTTEKIDSFERMVRPHGLIEMARTGEVAIARARPES